jgi:hypothetical protein
MRSISAISPVGAAAWRCPFSSPPQGSQQQPDYQQRCSDDGRSTAERLSMEATEALLRRLIG